MTAPYLFALLQRLYEEFGIFHGLFLEMPKILDVLIALVQLMLINLKMGMQQ